MSPSNPPDKSGNEVPALTERVKRLEDEVFKGGPPGFGERLRKIDEELSALQKGSKTQIQDLDAKIERVIRIVAELRKAIGQQGGTATA